MQESTLPFRSDDPIPAGEYDRPAGPPRQSRSVVMGTRGMVAASHPLAAQAGLELLKAGGSAVDAAIAANAMLGVVEPMSCGIGGDLFALHWDAATQKLHGLNASGRSPAELTPEFFRNQGLPEIPLFGPLSWSVPGCVDGWRELHQRFGQLAWSELLQPALETARRGFPVTEIIAAGWEKSVPRLSQWADSARTYLPDGRAPRAGEIHRNERIAAAYETIAGEGAEAFYHGWIAAEIDQFSRDCGGWLRLDDLAAHTSEWVEPLSTSYRGHEVWALPPNGQGIAVLQMLNLLEAWNLSDLGRHSPEYLHLLIEAKKLAYADRAKFYADPAFNRLPIQELISKAYAEERRKELSLDRAASNVPPGNPRIDAADTVYLCAVDGRGNACSLIQSIYHGFGSQVVPGNVGFALQNRGALFALDDQHFNRLEPRKRPFQTIIPGFVTRDNQPWFCFGVMGGDMQPQGQVQVLINMLDFGLNPQAAGDAARIRHGGSATPTGQPESPPGGFVAAETGIPVATLQALQNLGHQVVRSPGSYGGYQGILIDTVNDVLHGATDPRKDGAAVGY